MKAEIKVEGSKMVLTMGGRVFRISYRPERGDTFANTAASLLKTAEVNCVECFDRGTINHYSTGNHGAGAYVTHTTRCSCR